MAVKSPRELIEKILSANPNMDRADVSETMWKSVRRDPEYLRPMFEDWFAQNYFRFAKKRADKSNGSLVERMKKALMVHMLSNGVLLQDATGADCAGEGGWLLELSKMVKAHEVIGKALSIEEIWKVRAKHITEKLPNAKVA